VTSPTVEDPSTERLLGLFLLSDLREREERESERDMGNNIDSDDKAESLCSSAELMVR